MTYEGEILSTLEGQCDSQELSAALQVPAVPAFHVRGRVLVYAAASGASLSRTGHSIAGFVFLGCHAWYGRSTTLGNSARQERALVR